MTIASSSECGPIYLVTLLRTSILVILSLYDMFNNSALSTAFIMLLFLFAVPSLLSMSHTHIRKLSWLVTAVVGFSVCFSVLSYHITFSLHRAAILHDIVCPVLANISAFEPLSSMIVPKYLKLSTTFSGSLFIFISDVKLPSEICHYLCFRRVYFYSILSCSGVPVNSEQVNSDHF